MAITSVFNYVHNFAVVVALFGCFFNFGFVLFWGFVVIASLKQTLAF